MTAPTVVWSPKGWTESSAPCELIFLSPYQPACTHPAEVAFRLSCCGFVKHVCEAHFIYLKKHGMSQNRTHRCAGCGRRWRNFDMAVASYWRI